MQRPVAMQTDTQEPIEAREVVHVGVRDERVADAKKLPRHQWEIVAEIEHQRAMAEPEIDVDAGIGERLVDHSRLKLQAHGGPMDRTMARRNPTNKDLFSSNEATPCGSSPSPLSYDEA